MDHSTANKEVCGDKIKFFEILSEGMHLDEIELTCPLQPKKVDDYEKKSEMEHVDQKCKVRVVEEKPGKKFLVARHLVKGQNEKTQFSDIANISKSNIIAGNRNRTCKIKKGFVWMNNSGYLDATLFSLFYSTTIFDSRLLEEHSNNSYFGEHLRFVRILREIAYSLRDTGFCPTELVTKLRSSMCFYNVKYAGDMMDIEELLNCLFGRALQLEKFIYYKGGSSNFLLQIWPSCPQNPVGTVQNAFDGNMKQQNLIFARVPVPALILKMTISDGMHYGSACTLPNLTLDITKHLTIQNEAKTIMHLTVIIVEKSGHFTTFVRKGIQPKAPWVYFDSIISRVDDYPKLGEWLRDTENAICQNSYHVEKEKKSVLKQIMMNNYICIYFSPEATEAEIEH